MPVSPSSSPRRRFLNKQTSSQIHRSKFQIRVVPYSPPRLSADGATLGRHIPDASKPQPQILESSQFRGRGVLPRDERHANTESSQHAILIHPLTNRVITPDPAVNTNSYEHSTLSTLPIITRSISPQPNRPVSPSISSSRSLSPSPSLCRANRVINVHPDKTFSLLPHQSSLSPRKDSFTPSRVSSTVASSSYGRTSSGVFSDDRPSSALTTLAEYSPPPTCPTSPQLVFGNYQFTGGLRKVQNNAVEFSGNEHLAGYFTNKPLPPREDPPPLLSKQSSVSLQSMSNVSERTNYKVYGESSTISSLLSNSRENVLDTSLMFSSHSNFLTFLDSGSSTQSLDNQKRPPSQRSEANYVVHTGLSRSSSVVSKESSLGGPAYSQESLVVAPLRSVTGGASRQKTVSKSRSREALMSGSLSTISNFINHETTRALLFSKSAIFPGHSGGEGHTWHTSIPSSVSHHRQSSALSMVFSESEGDSEPPPRSLSPKCFGTQSSINTNRIRLVASLSSSTVSSDNIMTTTHHSRKGSLERPRGVYVRGNGREPHVTNARLVRDRDENGDGLAELGDLYHRPSRTQISSLFAAYSSDRNLRSSGSSRANSLTFASIPTWARLYYGGGERRLLASQSSYESMYSEHNDGQRATSFCKPSLSHDHFPTTLLSTRRSATEAQQQIPVGSREMAAQIFTHPVIAVAHNMKKQTSSIWSPHLRHDKRTNKYSFWVPPSILWSHETDHPWQRNIQLVLFIVGFILPFAWMFGALLPLPSEPRPEITEGCHSTSHLDLREAACHHMRTMSDLHHHNRTEWWRGINRRMSPVGVVVIGAYIALVIIGVRQQWH